MLDGIRCGMGNGRHSNRQREKQDTSWKFRHNFTMKKALAGLYPYSASTSVRALSRRMEWRRRSRSRFLKTHDGSCASLAGLHKNMPANPFVPTLLLQREATQSRLLQNWRAGSTLDSHADLHEYIGGAAYGLLAVPHCKKNILDLRPSGVYLADLPPEPVSCA